MHWLLSPTAVKCHFLGLGGIALFAFLFIHGDGVTPPEHYGTALLVWIIGYPLLLFLIWGLHRRELRKAERESQQPTPPQQQRRQRQRWRAVSLFICSGVGIVLCYLGLQGWEVDGLPAYFIGALLLGFALLGTFGVNVWYSGPLDRRADPAADLEGPTS